MIVTIQPRSIINVYLRRSTKIVQDSSSLCLLNFCRKNSSNLDAAIKSFFACISQIKSSSIPMSRFTSQLLHKYLHSSVMIFEGFLPFASDSKPLNFYASITIYFRTHLMCPQVFFHHLKLKICGSELKRFFSPVKHKVYFRPLLKCCHCFFFNSMRSGVSEFRKSNYHSANQQ